MKFKYIGPFAAVDVPDLGATVEQGDVVEVPDDLVDGFKGQACWESVSEPKAPKKAGAPGAASDSQEG